MTKPSSRGVTLALVNPAAGGGRGARRWQRLKQTIPELAFVEPLEASSAAEARERLGQRLATGDVGRLLVLGGDGTAHLAANVLLELEESGGPKAYAVELALVPAGTGSDLARHLELPRSAPRSMRRALEASPRPLDVIELTTDAGQRRFVLNTVSMGLAGAVTVAIESNPRRGQLSYLWTTVRELLRYEAPPCRVFANGEPMAEGGYFLVAITNGRFFGKGMKVAPDARSDDGRLDLILVPPMSLWSLPIRMPQFLSGRHVRWPEVTNRRVQEVRYEPGPGHTPFDLDGEPFPAAPVTLRVRPGALRVLA